MYKEPLFKCDVFSCIDQFLVIIVDFPLRGTAPVLAIF